MQCYKITFIAVLIVLLAIAGGDAKRHKKHRSSSSGAPSSKAKTKTKWSTSTDLGHNGAQLATEEHGYYVKRTFLPLNATTAAGRSPPYLAIPIAWYACDGAACNRANTAAISGSAVALQEGFLCDDDCVEPYEPICGKTASELAVFYNKCKLNVAKCRTHGLWLDVAYEECQKSHPKEVAYAERKFKTSPFFKDTKRIVVQKKKDEDNSSSEENDAVLDVALQALDKIGHQIAAAEAEALDEAATNTVVKSEVHAPIAKPVQENASSVKPAKEISTTAKPVKASVAPAAVENNVNKPVESSHLQPTVGIAAPEAGGNAAKVVVKK
ncbi:uncharacterized protein LOC105216381 [Zeugodacus cucurbitae]|uniref:C3 and PZP-like alpha-2-macroglobulin domain-containing protein 8 n=1 Tax=Zeugodacus cucurbitae TaxID=28588 RepID=A0A0A1X3J2_ZEUCU|nr:uncharacterized protein LOC105216381 [Zeugodacus cucurbitae]